MEFACFVIYIYYWGNLDLFYGPAIDPQPENRALTPPLSRPHAESLFFGDQHNSIDAAIPNTILTEHAKSIKMDEEIFP